MIHIVPLDQSRRQRWRNGGGSTQELLTWPAKDNWLVRISVASIEQSGPFSAYPNIERWFTVVQGDGVVLRFGQTEIVLRADSEPLRFDGATAPGCELLRDTTRDLNLMVQGDNGTGAMRRVTSGDPWLSAARFRAVYTAEPAVLIFADHLRTALRADTLAWSDAAAEQRWQLSGASDGTTLRAWWMSFADVLSPVVPHAN